MGIFKWKPNFPNFPTPIPTLRRKSFILKDSGKQECFTSIIPWDLGSNIVTSYLGYSFLKTIFQHYTRGHYHFWKETKSHGSCRLRIMLALKTLATLEHRFLVSSTETKLCTYALCVWDSNCAVSYIYFFYRNTCNIKSQFFEWTYVWVCFPRKHTCIKDYAHMRPSWAWIVVNASQEQLGFRTAQTLSIVKNLMNRMDL